MKRGLGTGVLVMVVVLVLGEIVASIADPRGEAIAGDRRWRSDAYPSVAASRAAFTDLQSYRIEPAPYVGYHLAPGQHFATLNVNSLAMRGPEPEAAGRTVTVIGASFVFGVGATSDRATVTARLGEALRRSTGEGIAVLNMGVPGYVTTQELADLNVRGLAQHPDVVVLLDGFNDAFVPLIGLAPGEPLPASGGWKAVVRGTLLRSRLGEVTVEAARHLSQATVELDPAKRAASLGAIADLYEKRIREAEATARAAGARFVHFLQPALLVGAKPLSDEEVRLRDRIEGCWDLEIGHCRRGVKDYVVEAYQALRAASSRLRATGVTSIDLTGVFDHTAGTRWIDLAHVADSGYAELAAAMAPSVRSALAR